MAGNTIWSFLQHLRFVRGVRIDGLMHDMVLRSSCFLVLPCVSLLPLQEWFVAFQLFFVGAFYVFAFLRQPAVLFVPPLSDVWVLVLLGIPTSFLLSPSHHL